MYSVMFTRKFVLVKKKPTAFMSVFGKRSSTLIHPFCENRRLFRRLFDLYVIIQEKYVETKSKWQSKYLYDKSVFW